MDNYRATGVDARRDSYTMGLACDTAVLSGGVDAGDVSGIDSIHTTNSLYPVFVQIYGE